MQFTKPGGGKMTSRHRTERALWTGTPLLVALALLVSAPAAPAQSGQPGARTTADAGVPAARPGDVASIDAILSAVYDAISGPAGEARDWERFYSLFLPEARLVPTGRGPDGSARYLVWTPREYVEAAGAQLEAGGFFEREVHRVEERFGGIAHAFSTYASFRTEEEMEAGTPFMRGINSFQLLHDGSRWWILQIYWQAEAPGLPIPDRYLDGD
jgi:hypothetical protein